MGMLPPILARGALSLVEGRPRPALSLWVDVQGGEVVARSLNKTVIVNREALRCGCVL